MAYYFNSDFITDFNSDCDPDSSLKNVVIGTAYYESIINSTGVSTEGLATGEYCYKLNNSTSDASSVNWYQNIDSGEVDAYPVIDANHNIVYLGGSKTCLNEVIDGSVFTNKESNTTIVHACDKIEASKETCGRAGNIEYYVCGDCKNIFLDKDGKNSIPIEEKIINPIEENN